MSLSSSEKAPVPAALRPQIPWMSFVLCALITGFQLASSLRSIADPDDSTFLLIQMGAKSSTLIAETGEGWRLFSSHLVHTGWTHCLFNLGFLFPCAGALESILRRLDFALLVIFVSTGAGLFTLVWTPEISGGASGLVFGLMAAAIGVGWLRGKRLGPELHIYFGWWVLPFLLAIVTVSLGNDQIDHFSHLGGFVFGLMAVPFLELHSRQPSPPGRQFLKAASVLNLAVLSIWLSPLLLTGGEGPRNYRAFGFQWSVPSSWRAQLGDFGELQFFGRSRRTSLHVEAIEGSTKQDLHLTQGVIDSYRGARKLSSVHGWRMLPNESETQQSLILQNEDEGLFRELRIQCPPAQSAEENECVIFAFEAPMAWRAKYRETRSAIFGSIRPHSTQ